jgi:dTDP-4-dehydrorhamnose reductase
MKNILITGVNGQIGKRMLPALINKYGTERIIASDYSEKLAPHYLHENYKDIKYEQIDVTDSSHLEHVITENKIKTVLNFAGMTSALSEEKPEAAKLINIDSVYYLMVLSKKYKLK